VEPRRTFADDDLESTYRSEGWVAIPLLDAGAAAELRESIGDLIRVRPDQFAATLYDADATYRATVDERLRPVFEELLAPWVVRQRTFVANLLVKPPGTGTDLGVHQDWTFVDEQRWSSATVWCPLVDVDEANGTLEVLGRSHRIAPSWRGSPKLVSPYDGIEEEVRHHGTALRLPAGTAVVYDHRLVHWSRPNLSGGDRPAIGVGIVPAEAPLIHLRGGDAGIVEYTVPDDFLHDFSFGAPPRHTAVRRVEHQPRALTIAAFLDRLVTVRGDV